MFSVKKDATKVKKSPTKVKMQANIFPHASLWFIKIFDLPKQN